MAGNIITGTSGDDTLTGQDGTPNIFNVWQGGTDALTGGGQNDLFIFRGAFTAADTVDGGAGTDTLRLHGSDYSDGLTLADDSLTSVEKIQFGDGFNYSLTTVNGNAPGTLVIDGAALTDGHTLTFDGSAETSGSFRIVGGQSDDVLSGSQNDDVFVLRNGGADTVHGGGGNDLILMNDTIDASDVLDGGAGNDTVKLEGMGLQDSLTWSATSLTGVEKLVLDHGYDYSFTGVDANIAAGKVLIVEDFDQDPGTNLLFYDGSAETNGHYVFKPELSIATLIGGDKSDRFVLEGDDATVTGGGGKDLFLAHSGADNTYIYNAASDSASLGYDTIQGADFSSDTFIMPWGTLTSVTDFDGGFVSKATFDANIGKALNDSLTAHSALVFDVTTGDLAGHSFLVVDVNGVAGYQAGADIVIDVTGYTGLLIAG